MVVFMPLTLLGFHGATTRAGYSLFGFNSGMMVYFPPDSGIRRGKLGVLQQFRGVYNA